MRKEKSKEPIRLRERMTPSGRRSLYLDIYSRGKRKYEYLHLYLLPGNSREVKAQNAATLTFAKDILARRIVEYRNGQYGFVTDHSDVPFIPYVEALMTSGDSSVTQTNLRNILHHIRTYSASPDITFGEITPQWMRDFKTYLDGLTSRTGKPLGAATKKCYLSSLKACLRKALKEGIITRDPSAGIENYRGSDARRMYLTVDELRRLQDTPCRNDTVRRIFLFSCLTGLRSSDIAGLRWGDVQTDGGFTRLVFRQKKTRQQEYLDITPQAVPLMGERRGDGEAVFPGIPRPNSVNEALSKWVRSAGITKHITFHCGRHTFATMVLGNGTDLYTVSKLLGHTDIKTTEIYAKVIDSRKQSAVAAIPDILGGE